MGHTDMVTVCREFPNLRFAPDGWKLNDENPFHDPDASESMVAARRSSASVSAVRAKTLGAGSPRTTRTFDRRWTGLFLAAAEDNRYWNGTSRSGLFSVSFNRGVADLPQRVFDFLCYERAAGRIVIVGSDTSASAASYLSELLDRASRNTGLRATDARHVVHSTTPAGWATISRDGVLLSPSVLRIKGGPVDPVGHRLLGDPDDFLDYIHFAPSDSINPEYVVLSREQGDITCDPDADYNPGARIYLDNHRMIADGLVVRDGLHHAKVYGRLVLSQYMIYSVAPPAGGGPWTPRRFCDHATRQFQAFLDSCSRDSH